MSKMETAGGNSRRLPLRRRALGAAAVLVVGLTGAAWSGCGDDSADNAAQQADQAVDQAQEKADQALEQGKEAAQEATQEAKDAIDQAEQQAEQAREQAGQSSNDY